MFYLKLLLLLPRVFVTPIELLFFFLHLFSILEPFLKCPTILGCSFLGQGLPACASLAPRGHPYLVTAYTHDHFWETFIFSFLTNFSLGSVTSSRNVFWTPSRRRGRGITTCNMQPFFLFLLLGEIHNIKFTVTK